MCVCNFCPVISFKSPNVHALFVKVHVLFVKVKTLFVKVHALFGLTKLTVLHKSKLSYVFVVPDVDFI